MTPVQLQQLKGNTQYHRDMSAYYLGRSSQGGALAARRQEESAPDAEPKAEGEGPGEESIAPTPRIGTEADTFAMLAQNHAEAARQLEELIDVESQTASRSLDEIRQVLPQRGSAQRGAVPRRDRAMARPTVVK